MTVQPVRIHAQPLRERLARQVPRLGEIAAAGDWSLPAFRRTVAPLLIAALGRVDGLPSPVQPAAGSGADWLLAQALQALRTDAGSPVGEPGDTEHRQRLALAAALVEGCARIHARWEARSIDGRGLDTSLEPLAFRISREGLEAYCAVPVPAPRAASGDRAVAVLLHLLRDLPACALAPLLGERGEALPMLVARLRAAQGDLPDPTSPEADAMADLVREGVWRVNRRKGRLWWIGRRLHLAWRTGARELAARCRVPGAVPLSPEALLERLHGLGLVRAPIRPLATPWTADLDAVELVDPTHWLALAACVEAPSGPPPLRAASAA